MSTFQEKILNLEPVNLFDYKNEFPEFVDLEKTPQSAKWHSEGNVLIHTNMVMEKAREIAITMPNQNDGVSIYLGGLLHDFGKPEATVVTADGKCPAHGHEGMGMWKAREFLRKHFPMFGYARREWILSLVEYHGHPKRMAKDESEDLRFKQLSLEANTEQLYHVEIADFTGRIGESADTAIGYLDKFKERCKTLNIWDAYYEAPNTQHLTQFEYNQVRWNVLFKGMKEGDTRKIEALQKLMARGPLELKIVIGAPGSGKTTHIKTLYPHIQTISMDDERARLGDIMDMSRNQEVYETCFRQLCDALKARQNVIWDATSVSRRLRKRLIDVARQHGALVSIVLFDLPLDVVLERNRNRERVVPEEVVRDYYRRIQSPKPYEYDLLKVVNETVKYETAESSK